MIEQCDLSCNANRVIGFVGHPMMGIFGFTIFILAVGLQARLTFFIVFLTDGTTTK